MPSPNVCVIGEPTPANITDGAADRFPDCAGVRIDPRLRIDERGVAASLRPLEPAREAEIRKNATHREAHMLPCRAMTMTRREAVGMLAIGAAAGMAGKFDGRWPRRRRAPRSRKARSSARFSVTCLRKRCAGPSLFHEHLSMRYPLGADVAFHRRRGADDRGSEAREGRRHRRDRRRRPRRHEPKRRCADAHLDGIGTADHRQRRLLHAAHLSPGHRDQ